MISSNLGGCLLGAFVVLGSGVATAGGYGYYYGHTGHGVSGQQGRAYYGGPARAGHAYPRPYGYPGYVRPQSGARHGQLPQLVPQQASDTVETRADRDEQAEDPAAAISGMRYGPSAIKVKVGDTVTWSSSDRMPHTITSRTGDFASSRTGAGGTFQHRFAEAGE